MSIQHARHSKPHVSSLHQYTTSKAHSSDSSTGEWTPRPRPLPLRNSRSETDPQRERECIHPYSYHPDRDEHHLKSKSQSDHKRNTSLVSDEEKRRRRYGIQEPVASASSSQNTNAGTELKKGSHTSLGSARSWMISSNLDALLEHDEKMRKMKDRASGTFVKSSSVPEGLPLPPRKRTLTSGRTGGRTVVTMSIVEDQEGEDVVDEENPFLNPCPPPLTTGMMAERDGRVNEHDKNTNNRHRLVKSRHAPTTL
jgi:hypothetical protein